MQTVKGGGFLEEGASWRRKWIEEEELLVRQRGACSRGVQGRQGRQRRGSVHVNDVWVLGGP